MKLSIIFLMLFSGLNFAYADQLTCKYTNKTPGCSGQPRVKEAKLQVVNGKFQLSYLKDACYYHGLVEFRGDVKTLEEGRSEIKAVLMAKAKREGLLGDDHKWVSDATKFKMKYYSAYHIAKVDSLVFHCQE